MSALLLQYLRPMLAAACLLAYFTSALPYGGDNYPGTGHHSVGEWGRVSYSRPHNQWGQGHSGQFRPPLSPPSQSWTARPFFQPSTTAANQLAVERIGFDSVRFTTDIVATENGIVNGVCKDGGRTYKEGDRWTPQDKCARHSCGKDGHVAVLGCPPTEVKDNCLPAAEDLRQPWPLCCATPVCAR